MDIQSQLDDARERQTDTEVTSVADRPLLTDAAIRTDTRKTDIVEVNFSDQTARVVESSNAPKLTLDVVKEKASPVEPAEVIFDQQKWHVRVRMGVPFSLNVKHSQLLEKHKDANTPEKVKARERAVKNLYIAEMIESPQFSYEEQGEGVSIEGCSDVLIGELWNAYCEKNMPIADDVHQVTVLRGTPIHASILLQDATTLYPAPLDKKIADLTEHEREATTQRSLASRRILVTSMVFPELFCFSLNGEGGDGEIATYPVENLSELFLQTLHTAYRVANVPSEGLDAVHRFRQISGNANGEEPTFA